MLVPKIRGFIKRIEEKTVAFDSCQQWEFVDPLWSPAGHCVRVKLDFDEGLKDKLIELSSGPCEVTVQNGNIVDIIKLTREEIDINRLDDVLAQSKRPMGLTQQALEIIKKLEGQREGFVPQDIALEKLQEELKLGLDKAGKLIVELEKEGYIYRPREGYLKVT